MIRPLPFLVLLLLTARLSAQNLVNNPSLETYSPCPTSSSQIAYATGWNYSLNSPEYLNVCSSSIYADVPTNYFGFQNAATGNAYLGLLAYGSFAGSYLANIREFAYITLTSPLTVGTTYYVSFKANLVDNSEYACNKLGIQFCSSWSGSFPINNTAQVYSTAVISDKTNWTQVTGSFVAGSAFNALMAGNFFDDANTTVSFVGSATDIGYNAYYFMDDFCVSPTPGVCYTVLDMDWGGEFIRVNGNEVALSWYAKPEGLQGFTIERSLGGSEFTTVAELSAQSATTQYEFNDVVLTQEPAALYRIRAIGKDGSTHLSRTLTARFYDDGLESLQIYPNPVKTGADLMVEYQLSEGADAPDLQILDLLGREVLRMDLPTSGAGAHTWAVPTSGIGTGTYIIKIGNRTRRLVLD